MLAIINCDNILGLSLKCLSILPLPSLIIIISCNIAENSIYFKS